MLTKLSETLKKIAKGWIVLIYFALELYFNAIALPKAGVKLGASSGGTGPIDLLFFYTPEKVYSMIDAYGEAGRALYRTIELTTDIVYPIVYTLFFSLAITWLFQRGLDKDHKFQRLNIVPFGAWLFDLLENLSIVIMLSSYPSQPGILAWIATVFTMIKWLFAGASIALLIIGIVAATRKAIERNKA